MASATSTSMMQDLLTGSEPDTTAPSYFGPPIGYSALVLNHITPIGYATTTLAGNLTAERPRYYLDCVDTDCFVCAPPIVQPKQPKPKLWLEIPSFAPGVKFEDSSFYKRFAAKGTQHCDDTMCQRCL